MRKQKTLEALLLLVVTASPLFAQNATPATSELKAGDNPAASEEAAAEQLQKAVQNPVASLISVPLQNNMNLNYGPFNRTQDVLNMQPVIPAHISENWQVRPPMAAG